MNTLAFCVLAVSFYIFSRWANPKSPKELMLFDAMAVTLIALCFVH